MSNWLKEIKRTWLVSSTIWEGTLKSLCKENFFAEYKDGVLTVEVNDSEIFCGDVESENRDPNKMTTKQMLSRINFRR